MTTAGPIRARSFFKTGDRVRMSQAAEKRLYPGGYDNAGEVRGTVVGFSRQPEIVKIQRDDGRKPKNFDSSDWEKM